MSVFSVLERLAPYIENEFNLILNSKQEAEILKSKLERIQDKLEEAERHSFTDNRVERQLVQLEDLMHEMEDALDQWETKGVELQMEQSELDNLVDPWRKVPSLLLRVCTSSFKDVVGRRKLVQEFKTLSGRLDRILDEENKYRVLSSNRSMDKSLLPEQEELETTSAVDKSKVHGRESETNRLVDLLLSKNDSARVVSIVGIGGLGKTTLAQLVYNDPRIKEHFGNFAWFSEGKPFDPVRVAKRILENFDKSSSGGSTLDILGKRIKAIASKQNSLLVLDNVMSVDQAKWKSLSSFLVGEKGFKILVTTRDSASAKTIGTTHYEYLDFLSDSDCAAIMKKLALKETSNGEKNEEFHKIILEIAKKCNGLPLAAETIGAALARKSTIREWKYMLESPLWKYEDDMSDILRPLRLSYTYLSPLLKCCFLSSVLCSKGFKFDSEELSRIWTAQGWIDSSGDREWDQVLTQGEKYLRDLSEYSFLQESGRNDKGNPTFEMHDMMYDFATYLYLKREYYVILDGRTDRIPYRRLPTGGRTRYFCARFVSKKDLPSDLFKLLNHARVLCLSDCDFEEFSEDLGKLIHLRYLDLSGNLMKELPENVSNLCNLQTLDLRRCRYLIRLPHLRKLIKLRHLLISDTDSLLEFHEELSKLSGLWTLDKCIGTRDSLLNSNSLRESVITEDYETSESTVCAEITEIMRLTCQNLLECVGVFHARDEAAEVQNPDVTCKIEEEESLEICKPIFLALARPKGDMGPSASRSENSPETVGKQNLPLKPEAPPRPKEPTMPQKPKVTYVSPPEKPFKPEKPKQPLLVMDYLSQPEPPPRPKKPVKPEKPKISYPVMEYSSQPKRPPCPIEPIKPKKPKEPKKPKQPKKPKIPYPVMEYSSQPEPPPCSIEPVKPEKPKEPEQPKIPYPVMEYSSQPEPPPYPIESVKPEKLKEPEKPKIPFSMMEYSSQPDPPPCPKKPMVVVIPPKEIVEKLSLSAHVSQYTKLQDFYEEEGCEIERKRTYQELRRYSYISTNPRCGENLSTSVPVSISLARAKTPRPQASKYLNNLRALDINGSQYSHLPDDLAYLPRLVTLRMQKMDFRALPSNFFYRGFPKLETLTFSECQLWEEWEDLEESDEEVILLDDWEEADEEVILPCLNYLAITLCPNLKALPHRLLRAAASLKELFVAGCPLLAAAYDKEMGGDWDQISHIPNTIILAEY